MKTQIYEEKNLGIELPLVTLTWGLDDKDQFF